MTKMKIPATLPEQVNLIKSMEISYRTLHPACKIHDKKTDRTIRIPFSSITNKYKDFLSTTVIEVELSKEEEEMYLFKPKRLSEDLYGTTELWNDMLILNKSFSIIDFRPKKIKVYDPMKLKKVLNEIIILEESSIVPVKRAY